MITKEMIKAYKKAQKSNFTLEQVIESANIATIKVQKGTEDEHATNVAFLKFVDGTSTMIFLEAFPEHSDVCFKFDHICGNIEKHGEDAVTSIAYVGKGVASMKINFMSVATARNFFKKIGTLDETIEAYRKQEAGEGENDSDLTNDILAGSGFDTCKGYSTPVPALRGKTVTVYAYHTIYDGDNAVFFDISEYKNTFAGICGKDAVAYEHPDFNLYHSSIRVKSQNEMKYFEAFKAMLEEDAE